MQNLQIGFFGHILFLFFQKLPNSKKTTSACKESIDDNDKVCQLSFKVGFFLLSFDQISLKKSTRYQTKSPMLGSNVSALQMWTSLQ